MGDINSDGEGLGSRAKARVRVRFLVKSMGRKGLWLELGARSNVKMRQD